MTKTNKPGKLSRNDMLRIGQQLRAHYEVDDTLTPELALLMARLKDRIG